MAVVTSFDEYRRRREIGGSYLSKREVADYLGFSVRWVEKQMQRGMPYTRIGGRARFRVGPVEQWLAEQEGVKHGVSAS